MQVGDLTSKRFRLERADGSVVIARLSFKASGRIDGRKTNNEASWKIKYGKLHIRGVNGRTTTFFHTENVDQHGYVLLGKYRGNVDPNWHILREICPTTQDEAYQDAVTSAAATDPARTDYFDFLLRVLKPRAVDPRWRSLPVIQLADIEAKGPNWRLLSPSFAAGRNALTIYEFDNATVLPHGGFVLDHAAIDEFLFCTQPNWREIGMAPVVANETPVAHFDVQSERVYLELPDPAGRVKGPHFWLGTPFAVVNFGHFVHDLATQLIHVDRARLWYGPRLKFIAAAFLAPGFRYPMQEFLFREFFGPIEDVVFHRGGRLDVETLCAGNPAFWLKAGSAGTISREALRYLSRRIRQRFAGLRSTVGSRRIYITRDDGIHRRQLENEAEVRALLFEHGFEPITISQLEPLEIIEKFYCAEVVVGIHGAGLLNIVFCDPDAVRLFELDVFPPAWTSIASFSRGMGLRYAKIPAVEGTAGNSYGATDIEMLRFEIDNL